jgi:hypothetical protein
MLATFYGVMGNAPQEDGALLAMADALCEEASVDRIQFALNRCKKECRFPVRLPDIFTRMPGFEVSRLDAEMRAAWDTVIRYVGKWGRWNCEYDRAYIEAGAPTLPSRIADTVRRSGEWKVYLDLKPENFPFQQKRFFEEYAAWTAVEREAVPLKQLVGEAQARKVVADTAMRPTKAPKAATPVPEKAEQYVPPSAAQLRDRRAGLKEQLAQIQAQRAKREPPPVPATLTAPIPGSLPSNCRKARARR